MHKHILITGLSGTGKTHLYKFFKEKGKNSYDADEALGRWVDKKTGKPKTPTKKEEEQARGIDWGWDGRKLNRILKQNNEVYLFGGLSEHTTQFVRLFDKIYYLYAGKELILQRLRSKDRNNDFGRHPEQRRLIISWIKYAAERAKREGFEFIDAALSPQQIFNIICKTGKRKRKLTK
jgi:shikimate kinase